MSRPNIQYSNITYYAIKQRQVKVEVVEENLEEAQPIILSLIDKLQLSKVEKVDEKPLTKNVTELYYKHQHPTKESQ